MSEMSRKKSHVCVFKAGSGYQPGKMGKTADLAQFSMKADHLKCCGFKHYSTISWWTKVGCKSVFTVKLPGLVTSSCTETKILSWRLGGWKKLIITGIMIIVTPTKTTTFHFYIYGHPLGYFWWPCCKFGLWSGIKTANDNKNDLQSYCTFAIFAEEWMLTSCKMSSSFGITQSSSEASLSEGVRGERGWEWTWEKERERQLQHWAQTVESNESLTSKSNH